ncbi:hypothetical protein [Aquibacillus salsiterrae]|uniref:Uncharacterized protein n=1 Tax=Aquibacillus salsiterrae TaxID=2950439 RepID=A0A9X3WCA3_9BACI|nr:hypothetical protein [Aquibacillus salsiterrae]MDC3417140.1 hypothetical protein [Aquibacillus salsiterrae]
MGLFINNDDHPDVYKNNGQLEDNNQQQFRLNYYSEMIKEHKELNNSLSKSFQRLNSHYQQHQINEQNQWQAMEEQLQKLANNQQKDKAFQQDALVRFNELTEQQKNLQHNLAASENTKSTILQELGQLHETNNQMLHQLESVESKSEEQLAMINQLIDTNQQLTKQLEQQSKTNERIDERLDNQEALMEKALRQLEHFRSIIFERSSDLAEKIEENYKATSQYVYELMTGKNLLVMRDKRDEKQDN